MPLMLPDEDFYLVLDGGLVLADWTGFATDTLEGLVAAYQDGTAVYPVSVAIEPQGNRYRYVIANALGEIIAEQPVSNDYDPAWWVKEHYPDLYIGKLTGDERSERDRLEALYDGSRFIMQYKLIDNGGLTALVWEESLDPGSTTTTMSSPPPPPVDTNSTSSGSAGDHGFLITRASYTNLELVGMWHTVSNGLISCIVGIPDDWTNSISLMACTNLVDQDWELLETFDPPSTTNIYEVEDDAATNSTMRFYRAYRTDADSDGDGVTDVEELVDGTDPDDSGDPPNIKGTITYASYSGGQTGQIWVVAVTSSNSWSTNNSATLAVPGAYHIVDVPSTSYWIKAWRDSDGDGQADTYEAQAFHTNSAVSVTGQLTGVDVALVDPDTDSDGLPDWWEMEHFDGLDKDGDDDPDSDSLVNSNEYAHSSDPNDPDTDDDRLEDGKEVNTYNTDPTDTDSDDDGMGDGAEVDHGNSPSSSNTYATLPFFEDFQFFDVLHPASNAQNFGYSVAAHSNRILVGAQHLTNGSAFVFHWDGTNWTQEAQLLPWASTTNDRFGFSVALSEDFAVVSAWGDSINGSDSGAAYVYAWDGTNWGNSAKLLPSDGSPGDRFGYALAVASNVVAVGAPMHDDTNTDTGAAYSFVWDGASWTNCMQKVPNSSSGSGRFGHSVALSESGRTLCIGEIGYSIAKGRANLYRWSGSNWTDRISKTPLVAQFWSHFGAAVAVSDDALIVGAPQYNQETGNDAGAAYVFEHQGTNWTAAAWTQTAMLCPDDLAKSDNFGQSVALIDGAAMVGTHKHSERANENAGALYLYGQSGTNWSYTGSVARELVTSSSYLGRSVAASSGRFVAGAYGEGDAGTVFSFPTNELFSCASSNSILRAPQWTSSTLHAGFLDHVCATNSNIALGVSPLFALDKTVKLLVGGDQVSTIWIDFEAMIAPSYQCGYESTPDMSDLAPWQATYFTIDSSGHPVALDGASTWCVASNVMVNAGDFHRYTVKQDYGDDVWSLYVDGSNVLSDLAFVTEGPSEFSCYSFAGALHAASYIDNVSISTNQPDFE